MSLHVLARRNVAIVWKGIQARVRNKNKADENQWYMLMSHLNLPLIDLQSHSSQLIPTIIAIDIPEALISHKDLAKLFLDYQRLNSLLG